MNRFRRFFRNEEGAAIVETAFALPVLIVLLWMIVQLGLVFRAMSGIQHALGEGARTATLFPFPEPSTTNTVIRDKMTAAVYGIGPGTFTIVPPFKGTADGSTYLDLQVTYVQQTDLLLFEGPTISVSRSKRVWVAENS